MRPLISSNAKPSPDESGFLPGRASQTTLLCGRTAPTASRNIAHTFTEGIETVSELTKEQREALEALKAWRKEARCNANALAVLRANDDLFRAADALIASEKKWVARGCEIHVGKRTEWTLYVESPVLAARICDLLNREGVEP